MLEDYKIKQPIPWKILSNEIKNNKMSHAYLFESNGCEDTFAVALAFAKTIMCPNNYFNKDKCVDCTQCNNIDKGNFFEIKIIEADGLWIKKEQLIELQNQFMTKSIISKKKVYIIKDADKLNTVAANSLLKFIEEPEENIIAILITPKRYQLLDTIVSRCQIVSFTQTSKSSDNLVEKIANCLYNTSKEIEKFINDENSIAKIKKVITFAQFFEKNKLDTLLYSYDLWTSTFKTKEEVLFAFELLLLYYRDLLSFICGQTLEIFDEQQFIKIVELNTISNVCSKIEKIIELKNHIKLNANSNLLLDKLIIELSTIS